MRIRFLQMVPSDRPEYPFMAGQVLDMPVLPESVREAIDDGRAEVIPSDDTERAIEPALQRSEPKRGKRAR